MCDPKSNVNFLIDFKLVLSFDHFDPYDYSICCLLVPVILLPTGSEEREVLWVGSIPVAILPPCHNMKLNHYNCINMNIVG